MDAKYRDRQLPLQLQREHALSTLPAFFTQWLHLDSHRSVHRCHRPPTVFPGGASVPRPDDRQVSRPHPQSRATAPVGGPGPHRVPRTRA